MKRPDITAAMAVCDGRTTLGYIAPIDGGFYAWSATNSPLGTFPTIKSAKDKICGRAYSGGSHDDVPE